MANLIVSALATWNGKALNKGKSDISAFDKSVTKLGKTFAGVFAASSILAFSKKAVNAFAADQAAAKSLELQLINTGNAFRVSEVEGYLKSLEKTYAILTDLRAPFKTLLNVTGSIETSQRLLNDALNISAGTGESLDSVISAITSGLRGQTKGIKGLNTGIDANIIATGDMNKIMEALEARFKGQAKARLDTFAGKMDALTLGTKLATKAIGGGLVDALTILSKDNSIANLATDFENLGKNIAFVIVQLAKLLDKVSGITSSPSFKPLILLLGGAASAASGNPLPLAGAFGLVATMGVGGALTKNYQRPISDSENSALGRKRLADRVKAGKIQSDLNRYNAQALALLKAKSEVDKLKEKFDLERIGINAALSNATDDETKLRLKAQLAILDNNEALAKKYNAELDAARGAKELADSFHLAGLTILSSSAEIKKYMADSMAAYTAYLNSIVGKNIPANAPYAGPTYPDSTTAAIVNQASEAEMARIAGVTIPTFLEKLRTTVKDGYNIPSPESFYGNLPDTTSTQIARSMAISSAAPTINVNVEGSVLALSEMDDAIQQALLRIYKQNGDLMPAGFIMP